MVFENIQKELSELVGLVRQSERWVRVTRPKRTKLSLPGVCFAKGCWVRLRSTAGACLGSSRFKESS